MGVGKVLALAIAVALDSAASAHSDSACQNFYSSLQGESDSPKVLNIRGTADDLTQAMAVLDGPQAFDLRFPSVEAFIAFQADHPDFARKLGNQTWSFAFNFDEKNRNLFLAELNSLRLKSKQAAIEVQGRNNLFLETFIPWSYYVRDHFTKMKVSGKIDLLAIEAQLERELYMAFNRDGSMSLRNYGYRQYMSQQLLNAVPEGRTLKVFRGMKGSQGNFIKFMTSFAKGKKCPQCRKNLIEELLPYQKNITDSTSDEQVLRLAYSKIYSKFDCIFTTPDPKWAKHWGGGNVYELQIDIRALPKSIRDRVYIAADGAHNMGGGVVEIDFPFQNFDHLTQLFTYTEIKSVEGKVPLNRINPIGKEIPQAEDLRRSSFY